MKTMEVKDGYIKIFAGGQTQINTNNIFTKGFNIHKSPAVIVKSRGLIDVEYYDKPFTFKQEMWAYVGDESELLTKYLYYILKNNIGILQDKGSKMGSMPQIKLEDTEEMEIPVPPLKVQEKIVEVLDNFDKICSDLKIGLPAEIEKRNQQYEFYRNELLTFVDKCGRTNERTNEPYLLNDDIEKLLIYIFGLQNTKINKIMLKYCNFLKQINLSDVCNFTRGKSLTSADAITGNIPVIAGGQKPAFYHNVFNRTGETVTIAGSGAYAGFVQYFDVPIFCSDCFTVDIIDTKILNTKYLYYFLKNNQQKIYDTKSGSGVPHVYGKNISNFIIPIPPLEVQQEIVEMLNKFNDYCNSMTQGLIGEIEANHKRYEYYRNELLNFKKKASPV